jgi:hypothetical protein
VKDPQQQAAAKLGHALTFLRLAKLSEFAVMRKQYLDEAERLIEYAVGVLGERE